jgi:hypothetical protein
MDTAPTTFDPNGTGRRRCQAAQTGGSHGLQVEAAELRSNPDPQSGHRLTCPQRKGKGDNMKNFGPKMTAFAAIRVMPNVTRSTRCKDKQVPALR